MRHTAIFILLLTATLFLIGCSDDPASPVQNKPVVSEFQEPSPVIAGSIPLEGIVRSTWDDDKSLFHEINGLTAFEISFVTPACRNKLVDVTLRTEAKLVPMFGTGNGFDVVDRSIERVHVDAKGVGTIKKRLVIGDRMDNRNLYLLFSLQGRELKLQEISIEREK